MTHGNQSPAGVWPSVETKLLRFNWERSAGIALTLLLHAGLLALLLYMSAKPVIESRLVQAAQVVDARLIPQAQVLPVAISRPKPTEQARLRPRRVPVKPTVQQAEQTRQLTVTSIVAASTASSAPPPQPASAGLVEPLPMAYLTQVMMTIGLNRRYPLKALAKREQGTAVVHIHLARDGSVLDATVIRSSGSAVLDAEARDVVYRIGKFQPLAAQYARGAEEFAIDQPIRFSGY